MRICFLILFLSLLNFCYGQKRQAAIWAYGAENRLDFNTSPITVSRFPYVAGIYGNASICDSIGVLQFFANGSFVINRKSQFMVRLSLQYPQYGPGNYGCNIIIPYQTNSYLYQYFSIRGPFGNFGRYRIYRFVIDMRMNNGLGGFDNSLTKIIHDGADLQIACMLHANGNDSWLISRKWLSDSLMALHVVDTGIVTTVYSKTYSPAIIPNIEGSPLGASYDAQLKSSPNSELLLNPRRRKEFPFHELYKFDREMGTFSRPLFIRDTMKTTQFYLNGYPDGAFSPDSKLLYIGTGTRTKADYVNEGPGHFWQFSLSNYDSLSIAQSRTYLGMLGRGVPSKPEIWPFGPKFQLAIDGKIYVSPGIETDSLLSIIHCPNTLGSGCLLKLREINLKKGKTGSYFPTLNQTFVRNAGIFQLQANKRSICQNDTLELSGYGAGAEQFQWSVSPAFPASVKLDTLTWQKIPTRQLAPGIYTFSCRAFSRCGDVFEKTISVEIKPLPARPNVTTIQKTVPCKGDSVIVKVQNPVLGNQYFWSTGDTASFTIVRQSGLYSLDSVSNAVGCGLKVGDTLAVVIKDILVPDEPVLASPQLVEVCAGVQSSTLKVQSTGRSVVWNTSQTGDSVSVSGAGKYWAIHQTEEGCTSAASDTIHVVVVPLPLVQLLASDNGHCLGNEETKRYKVISFNSKVKTVEVEGGEVVEETDSTITVHWFEGTQSQSQNRLTIKSQNRLGCSGADLVFSPIPNPEACRDLYPLFIPNLVTANNDKHNDRWEMGNILYHQPVSVRIYNRWGQTVFETDSYQNNWPSTSLSSGTYFYRVSSFGKEWKGWMEVNDK